MLIVLAGCLGQEREETITLTWWITYAADSDEYPVFQELAQSYGQEMGCEIELVSVPWDDLAPRGGAASRLALAQASGQGPDVWGPVPHTWIASEATQGNVLALEPTQIRDVQQYTNAARQACQLQGKQVGLPVLTDSIALIYNKDLVSDPPKSFEELLTIAADLTDAKEERWGLAMPLLSQVHVYPFIAGYGGYIWNCDIGQCDLGDIGLNNEGAVRGIQFLSDLYLKEKLFSDPLADRAVMYDHALQLFVAGQAAMLIDGPWSLPEIRAHHINYGVATIPDLPEAKGPSRPLTVVYAVAASANTKYPDQAVELLNHMASAESALAMYDVLLKIPVRRDALFSPELRDNAEIKAWRDQAEIGVPLPNVPALDYVWTPWGRALDAAIPGLVPVQDALDQAVEQIQTYVQEDE
jgi:arabinogalactan oligomer/maltooligosaccharide transport system substrate-binding protein